MAVGTVELHLPDIGSLKGKRHALKGLKDTLRRRFEISVAEVDHHDVWQRATLALAHVAKGHAFIQGRAYVVPEDVKAVAVPALAHRIALRPDSWVAGIKGEGIVQEVLDSVPAPPPEPEGGR